MIRKASLENRVVEVGALRPVREHDSRDAGQPPEGGALAAPGVFAPRGHERRGATEVELVACAHRRSTVQSDAEREVSAA